MPRPAAEVEDPLPLGHPDLQDAGQVLVVVVTATGPLQAVVVALVEALNLVENRVRDAGQASLAHRSRRR
jgi:hypothetical protein